MKSWQRRLRALNIDPDQAYQNLEEAFNKPSREMEIQEVRKEISRERPLVKAEIVEPVKISSFGPVTLHMRFDADEVSGASVHSVRINEIELVVDDQRSWPSPSSTLDGHPQVDWVVQGRASDPVEAQNLLRSTSFFLEGSLGANRRFTAFWANHQA